MGKGNFFSIGRYSRFSKVLLFFIFLVVVISIICIYRQSTIIKTQNNVKKLSDNEIKNMNHIWLYWETPPGKTRPTYIDLCYDTIKKHCSKNFKVHLLDEKSVYTYLPKLRRDINNLRIPQKADYIRLALLKKYGGIWLDSDIIVFSDLIDYINKLKDYDFIGFGCHFKTCSTNPSGYPKPANWALVSRPNGILVTECLNKADEILKNGTKNMELPKNYHILGRSLLWECINKLLKTGSWDYYHVPSTCIDRDYDNMKWTNKRALSTEFLDKRCSSNLKLTPIYHTAPGFPSWFLKLSKDEILKSEYLVSSMFRKSLNN